MQNETVLLREYVYTINAELLIPKLDAIEEQQIFTETVISF
jgi:hypothetical protein